METDTKNKNKIKSLKLQKHQVNLKNHTITPKNNKNLTIWIEDKDHLAAYKHRR